MALLDITDGVLSYRGEGSENNKLTVTYNAGSYGFKDDVAIITLGPGALAAGWRGTGTNTATGSGASLSGVAIDLGAGSNQAMIRQAAHPMTVTGGGNTSVVVGSLAPFTIGNLD